jgi:hypothetical protein
MPGSRKKSGQRFKANAVRIVEESDNPITQTYISG